MVKATFKQGEYESKLSEALRMMDLCSRHFKDLADQCSYQTQVSTLGELKTFRFQEKANSRSVIQSIAHSRSEANLQHQNLHTQIMGLRTNQAIQKAESDAANNEIRKFLKEFHRSNSRIDMRTNDSQYSDKSRN